MQRGYHLKFISEIEKFKRWLQSKRYSDNTIKTYIEALKVFIDFNDAKGLNEISNEDFILFNTQYILSRKLSSSYQNQVVNAIKLFFSIVKDKKLELEKLHRPRREHKLPNVLSKEEVKAILACSVNSKHKAMLSLIYSAGLRCGELLKLKLNDIDSNRMLIIVREAKGKKDRIITLSGKVLLLLKEYYKVFRPKVWLFEGQRPSEPYSERSLQLVLKQAVKRAKINKPVSLHWLRHSYATHLLESGTDLRYIQELLGHKSSRTTEIYTHVSTRNIQNIKSPFDDL